MIKLFYGTKNLKEKNTYINQNNLSNLIYAKNKNILLVTMFESVGTIKSTINSATSLSRYSDNYDVFIINTFGEWDFYKEELKKKLN